MRVATIDCGTNTVLLLVAEVAPGQPVRAVEERIALTRLGQGLDRSGRLDEAAMARTLEAMQQHAARARQLGADPIAVVGTESLRAAANSAEFLARAAALGLPVRILSAQQEAHLAWRAVSASLPLPAGAWRSVLDIGGGSTELIVGQGGDRSPPIWHSIPVGSVRITERYLHGDPPTEAERRAARAAIAEAVAQLPAPRGELCGVAGTVTTLAALHLGLRAHDSARLEGHRVPVPELAALVQQLGTLSAAARRELGGLDPRRADVIYAGGEILLAVCERAGASQVLISDRGVRWGALLELADALDPSRGSQS
ncbi:MAG: Ppx/GppA family phosphatase [Myxococcales bacterium]|nr:Ppx/GppA family phosphatase [Myxococcota bacterium]MDW8280274.1 Ppx/GppA family phosphatase [Myxococcales bacterium]